MSQFQLVCTTLTIAFLGASAASAATAAFDWNLLASDDTLALFVKEARVGRLCHRTVVDSSRTCVRITEEVVVGAGSGATLGFGGAMVLHESREYDFDGSLVNATQTLQAETGTNTWRLTRDGAGSWTLEISAGGQVSRKSVAAVHSGLAGLYTIQKSIVEGRARVGQEWVDTVFELMSAQHMVVRTTCLSVPSGGDTVYTFVNRDNVIRREEKWVVDRQGRTLMREVAPVFTAVRVGEASEKNAAKRTSSVAELADRFGVDAKRAPGADESIVLVLAEGAELHESVRDLYVERSGTEYVLLAMPRECRGVKSGRAGDSVFLRATPTIQAGADTIRSLAGRLSKGGRGPCGVIKAMNDHVFGSIEKRNVATFSSALETLKAGAGDCGEHAVLLAALLRAAGIPCRVIYGLVYLRSKDGYMYHVWVQVKGTEWIGVDPALGKFPAWNGYVPLIVDDTGENSVFLGGLIDRISIKYVPIGANNK